MNISPEAGAAAIRVLRSVPDIEVKVAAGRVVPGNALVRYGGTTSRVAVMYGARVNSAFAHLAVSEQNGDPLVVIAKEMTRKACEILAGAGIGYVTGRGDVLMALPGVFVRMVAAKAPARPPGPVRLAGKSGLVAQALLMETERDWKVSEVVERAGVSSGLASRVLGRLESEGVVVAQGSGPRKTRRVSNPTALLDLWVEEDRCPRLRYPGFLLGRTPAETLRLLSERLDAVAVDYALTGTLACSLSAPHLTHHLQWEVWLESTANAPRVTTDIGVSPVALGANIVFLQGSDETPLAFRTRMDGMWVANPFRAYADARAHPARGLEQAEHFRQEVIGF